VDRRQAGADAAPARFAPARLVKRRTQVKNEIAAVLHRNLKGRNPASDPFGREGRA
jgi:hypothetical protein